MSIERQEYEAKVMMLPLNDRAILAERLIASLDSLDSTENERLWLDEAERRYQAYKAGTLSARSAVDVIREAREKIK